MEEMEQGRAIDFAEAMRQLERLEAVAQRVLDEELEL